MTDEARTLKIKAGSVRRLTKELDSYITEAATEEAKVAGMRAGGADPHDLKHAVRRGERGEAGTGGERAHASASAARHRPSSPSLSPLLPPGKRAGRGRPHGPGHPHPAGGGAGGLGRGAGEERRKGESARERSCFPFPPPPAQPRPLLTRFRSLSLSLSRSSLSQDATPADAVEEDDLAAAKETASAAKAKLAA